MTIFLSTVACCAVPVPNVSAAPLVSAPSQCGSHQSKGHFVPNVVIPTQVNDGRPLDDPLPIHSPPPSVPQGDQLACSALLPGECPKGNHEHRASEANTSRPSLSSTLPQLQGLFNKPSWPSRQTAVTPFCLLLNFNSCTVFFLYPQSLSLHPGAMPLVVAFAVGVENNMILVQRREGWDTCYIK